MDPSRAVIILLMSLSSMLIVWCNPVSEDIDEPLWNSLHNARPFQSEFYHNADYRFPQKVCNEAQCHGNSLTGGNSGSPSCYKCHDDQWTIFGVSHTMKIGGYYHRNNTDSYVSETAVNTGWFLSCRDASCHGTTLDGNQGGPSANYPYRYSCKVCHGDFAPNTIPPPGHRVRESEEGVTGWHHYRYESADPDGGSGNVAYCSGAACHNTDGKSDGTAADGTGGLGVAAHGRACNTAGCHD